MKIAYFDCFAGISGDMIIGAFIDSGVDFNTLKNELDKLNVKDYGLKSSVVLKNGIRGTKFDVIVREQKHHRNLQDITKIITESSLDNDIKKRSVAIFTDIARVEANVHGKTISEVHFHEVGALDSIIDIVGAVIALKLSGIERVYCSPVNTGSGFAETAHGTLPVPAPATAELLRGIPVYSSGIRCELTTPTGAAIISNFAEDFGEMPEMKISKTGYGAGTKDLSMPNLLRIFTGDMADEEYLTDHVIMCETNIDDMNPELYQHISQCLFKKGALDVFYTPVIMKKERPALVLNILAEENNIDPLLDILFRETTSSGVRLNKMMRKKLHREIVPIDTRYGKINVKVHRKGGKIVTISPEYEDCRKIAEEKGIPLNEVYDESISQARKTVQIDI